MSSTRYHRGSTLQLSPVIVAGAENSGFHGERISSLHRTGLRTWKSNQVWSFIRYQSCTCAAALFIHAGKLMEHSYPKKTKHFVIQVIHSLMDYVGLHNLIEVGSRRNMLFLHTARECGRPVINLTFLDFSLGRRYSEGTSGAVYWAKAGANQGMEWLL